VEYRIAGTVFPAPYDVTTLRR